MKSNNITDISALLEWNKIEKKYREKILNNVHCSKCRATTIIDYSIELDRYGIILRGKCKTCGRDVARVVENG